MVFALAALALAALARPPAPGASDFFGPKVSKTDLPARARFALEPALVPSSDASRGDAASGDATVATVVASA